MKRSFWIFILSILSIQFSNAQISVGGMVGVNYSNVITEQNALSESDYVLNYFLGLSSSIPLSDRLNFIGEAQYALKGWSLPVAPNAPEFKVRVNYLDLIPKIEYRPAEFIGIALGVNLGVNVGEATKTSTGAWQKSTGIARVFNSNFALTGSVRGYFGNLFIDLGYFHGLNRISDVNFTDANGAILGNTRSYMRNFNLGVGYLFEL